MKTFLIATLTLGSLISGAHAAGADLLMKCKVDKVTTLQVTKSNNAHPVLTEFQNGRRLHTTNLTAGKTYNEIIGNVHPKDDFSLDVLRGKKISPSKAVMVRVAHIDDLGTQLISYHDINAKQLVAVTVFPSIDPEGSYCLE